jgi:hypothetical protein
MVVVQTKPAFRWMDRSGICSSTRKIALDLWDGQIPNRDRNQLVRELYERENTGKPEPSGSQDMVGLVYPGVNRLDYDIKFEGGLFPAHIESDNDPDVARWLESVLYVIPVAPRPPGYSPLGRRNMDPQWIARLGKSGQACFDAIVTCDTARLGQSFNECISCWRAILPDTVDHPALTVDLMALLEYYQQRYAGAMYSGCGGGYLFVASHEAVPGAFQIEVRTEGD